MFLLLIYSVSIIRLKSFYHSCIVFLLFAGQHIENPDVEHAPLHPDATLLRFSQNRKQNGLGDERKYETDFTDLCKR